MAKCSKRILIADDDPAIVESTKLILEEFGYTVDYTYDGKIVYEMKDNFPDLMLLDIWMSGQDGRDICKYVKKDPRKKIIPVIMISASRDIKKSALAVGANDFLEKPFDMEDLLAKINKLIN